MILTHGSGVGTRNVETGNCKTMGRAKASGSQLTAAQDFLSTWRQASLLETLLRCSCCSLTTIYTVVLASAFRLVHLLDLTITLAGLAGLWGYAFRKRLLSASFWRVQSLLFPIWEIVMNFVFSRVPAGRAGYVEVLTLMSFFVPEYWALWKYGYRSPDIWSTDPPYNDPSQGDLDNAPPAGFLRQRQ